jgi:hypothetical protein
MLSCNVKIRAAARRLRPAPIAILQSPRKWLALRRRSPAAGAAEPVHIESWCFDRAAGVNCCDAAEIPNPDVGLDHIADNDMSNCVRQYAPTRDPASTRVVVS